MSEARVLGRLAVRAGLATCLFAGAVLAMPVDTDPLQQIPGVNDRGELDIREVLDNSTEMDVRLTKQIMLLQRQINPRTREIETLRADR